MLPDLRTKLNLKCNILMLSGTPIDAKELAKVFHLNNPEFITHVCDRDNIFVEVRKKGTMKETFTSELDAMMKDATVVYCNSAKKAKLVKGYLEGAGVVFFYIPDS